ncbi:MULTISPECIES: cell division protein FtsA [Snodgrassella]|uniref:Cell division protein FtsA n=1 Tax=Snodgrassella alvi TaxID=1196083 RepID=A0A1X0TBB9_9NEIS|nr:MULTISPECIES: cell division protein FtsA [Snodgrassella]MBI0066989.1 cell division protein FtsA [Snodgrassella sp. M0110]MBI0076092.1 cell division protein FtsA [Snodgrassella sp. M0118]MBI0078290.1 cell division protein FtsA [Snodgrassella sp. M0112]MBI0097543.1 cell division protein FtsA [Snodgrassella sp. W8134]MBI0100724.1 cell division protein FtsA [Snodgrassella sp. W8135]
MVKGKKYISALDIGTSKVIALIGEVQEDNEIHIVGLGQAPSRGLKAGMVTNIETTAQAIKQAMEEAQMMADVQVDCVTTGIAGNHIRSFNSQGVVKIKDGEVSQADIDRAIETAKAVNIPPDHDILHTVVQEFIIDNQPGVREPIGMSGVRLDTRIHIITGAVTAMQNIQKCVNRCGLQINKMILQPLASGQAVLTEDEKDLGVCVIDIGGGTTDIAVYTNGAIRHTAVIPVAGDLITKDLAQALRTPHSAAEYIKINHGVALATMDGLDDMIEVPSVGDRNPRQISRRTLASVIGPRVEEILELTLNELRRSGFPEDVLTSGIVLTGGASLLPGMVELAEDVFNLPARIGVPQEMGGVSERIRNPRYATAIGLLQSACEEENKTDMPVAAASEPKDSWLKKLQTWFKNNF